MTSSEHTTSQLEFGTKRVLQIIVLILALFAVAAYLTLNPQPRSAGIVQPTEEASPETISAVVKAVLPSAPVRTLVGYVVAVEQERIVVDVPQILGVRIPQESDLRLRAVLVSEETEVFEYGRKTTAQFRGELQTLLRGQTRSGLPSPYASLAIALGDLRQGDRIFISGNGQDVKTLPTIQATRIIRYR